MPEENDNDNIAEENEEQNFTVENPSLDLEVRNYCIAGLSQLYADLNLNYRQFKLISQIDLFLCQMPMIESGGFPYVRLDNI